jgi:hypothetical protein
MNLGGGGGGGRRRGGGELPIELDPGGVCSVFIDVSLGAFLGGEGYAELKVSGTERSGGDRRTKQVGNP